MLHLMRAPFVGPMTPVPRVGVALGMSITLLAGFSAFPEALGQDALPLNPTRVPAEVRTLGDGRALLIYRGAFRGYAPAGASAIEIRDRRGEVQFDRRPGLDLHEATIVTLLDATVSRRGQVVASMVVARPGAGTSHVLGYYPMAGKAAVRLVVAPFACFRVTTAVDDGVWCLGPHVERHNARSTDFRFLHHFSEDGTLVKSVAERAEFPGAPAPWDSRAQFTVTADRLVVWMAGRGALVTFDADGRVVNHRSVPDAPIVKDPRTDFILGSTGDLYVLGITEQPSPSLESWRRDLFRLSAETSRWIPRGVGNLSLRTRLVGARGNDVTLWDRQNARLVTVAH